MKNERLEGLLMISTHRDALPSIDEIINKFAVTGARKLNFIL